MQYRLFQRRMKAADDSMLLLGLFKCPAHGSTDRQARALAGSEKGRYGGFEQGAIAYAFQCFALVFGFP